MQFPKLEFNLESEILTCFTIEKFKLVFAGFVLEFRLDNGNFVAAVGSEDFSTQLIESSHLRFPKDYISNRYSLYKHPYHIHDKINVMV